jgi:hypothetical protein
MTQYEEGKLKDISDTLEIVSIDTKSLMYKVCQRDRHASDMLDLLDGLMTVVGVYIVRIQSIIQREGGKVK